MATDTASRRVDVFFYGLFMDETLLRAQGLEPQGAEQATVRGFALRIGQRATLVPGADGTVHGMVFSLTLAELSKLYSEPSVEAYRPHAVLARLSDGHSVPALCYSLPNPPPSEANSEYAVKLRAVAEKIRLPRDYIDSLR
jgi:Gamma-glutamyl cyclotransferase, AIG2-like